MKFSVDIDDDQVEKITRDGIKDAIQNFCFIQSFNPKFEDPKKLKEIDKDAYKDYKALVRAYEFFGGQFP